MSHSTRRRFVQGLGIAAGLTAAPAFLRGPRGDAAETDSRVFPLGVASGDPRASSVALWTRVAPSPLRGGGMGRRVIPVRWEVFADPLLSRSVASGVALARPENGHAVKTTVTGLAADRWYWYRFSTLGETSRVGRTRTFPGAGQQTGVARFGLVSCQNFQQGFYHAYRDLAEQEADFVVHVGDYIYESGPTSEPIAPGRVHNSPEIFSVEDYRNRYALHRLDPYLKAAHARFPFILTWDDHEVDNNYAGDVAEDDQEREAFLERRANAYQVYFESMPLRSEQRPNGPNLPLFRRLRFGDLADIHVLDTRQFRTDQPCGDGFGSTDPAALGLEQALGQTLFCGPELTDPAATMTGAEQEAWLMDGLRSSDAVWNILAQQVMVMRWDLGAVGAAAFQTPLDNLFNVDAWDGYPTARERLLRFLADNRPSNPVVLTGDIHSAWAANLLADFRDPASDAVGAEFVCTSISSNFGDDNDALVRATLPANPHIRYFNGLNRGYTLCEATREAWVAEYRAVENNLVEESSVSSAAVFRLPAGFNAPNNGGAALERV